MQEKSLTEQIAELQRENERLRSALTECLAAREKAEQDLVRTHEEARASTEDIQHLIYAVSHDLRAPLRAVASYAQLLQKQYASDPEASELSNFAVEGVKEMNTLIEDLLKYSRAGNSPRRTAVSLNSVVQWAVMNVQSTLQELGGEIVAGDLPQVNVDESQFVQVFHQLFTNAMKFRSQAPPRVDVSAAKGDGECTISVADNGVGIDSQYLETVFMPFKRLQGRNIPGNGLGLSVCRKILRAHGGKIWAESAGKGQGATFKFTVPF